MMHVVGERRRSSRRDALLSSRLVFNNGRSVLDCTVRDISDIGARVSLEAAATVPDRFALAVKGPLDGRVWLCRVVRRGPSELGVVFE